MPRTSKGQSSPTLLSSVEVNGKTVGYTAGAAEAADVPAQTHRLVSFSRRGVSINLPEDFGIRALVFVIALSCYAAGAILQQVASEWKSALASDEEEEE